MDLVFLSSYVVLWALVVLAVLVLLVVIRDLAVLKMRLGPEPGALATAHGPRIGEEIPPLQGTLFGGGDLQTATGRRALLLFVSPHCQPCLALLPELRAFMREGHEVATYLVCQGSLPEIQSLTGLFKIDVPIVIDTDGRITKQTYGVAATPFGIAVDENWVVRSKGITNQQEHLEALIKFEITPQGERQLTPIDPVQA